MVMLSQIMVNSFLSCPPEAGAAYVWQGSR